MGNLTSRSLGTPPADDGTVLSVPGRHLRASTSVTGQVDRLSFTFLGTTPKISVVTSNGLDHTVSYDNAGNETGYYVARTYSPRNLTSSVTDTSGEGPAHSVTYGYDYRGVRVSRSETPTDAGSANRYYFYTPELQLLASTVDDSNNAWGQSAHTMSAPLVMNREIIWFNGQPVGEFGPPRTPDSTVELSRHRTFDTNTPANNLFYTFTDHLGTPLIQTDPTTAIVWRAEHEPYGNVYLMRQGARTDQPLRLPGQDLAMTWEGTEENYNVFRWYRGGWGRYTQADPIGLKGGIALFAYADDDPIGESDQRGLFAQLLCRQVTVNGLTGAKKTIVNTYKPVHCRLRVKCGCGGPNSFDTTVGRENVNPQGSPGIFALTKDSFSPSGYPSPTWGSYPVDGSGTNCEFEKCVQKAFQAQQSTSGLVPPYNPLGPNSNTFVHNLISQCGGSAAQPPKAYGW